MTFDTLKHAAAMLAAGVAAAGLMLVASTLTPTTDPSPHDDQGHANSEGSAPLTTESIVGRWEFVDSPNDSAFVEFTEYGSWFGSDGCNVTGSGWHIADGAVVVGPGGGHTFAWCENVNLPTNGGDGTLLKSGNLEFAGADGDTVELTRARERAATLVGGAWEVTNLPGRALDQIPHPMRIEFQDDGTWTGVDGCNSVTGIWSWELVGASGTRSGYGGVLHFGENTSSTAVACSLDPMFLGQSAGDIEFAFRGENQLALFSPKGDDFDRSRAFFNRDSTESSSH